MVINHEFLWRRALRQSSSLCEEGRGQRGQPEEFEYWVVL